MKIKNEKLFKKYMENKKKDKEFQLIYEEIKMHLKIARLIEKLRLKANMTQT